MAGKARAKYGSIVDGFYDELQSVDESEVQGILKKYVRDLTAEASGNFVFNPEYAEQIDRASWILHRKRKRNPVLIGSSSEVCQAVVEGVAYQMMRGDVPERLLGKRMIMFDTNELETTAFDEHYEKCIKAVLKYILDSNDQKILFFAPCPKLIVHHEYSGVPGKTGIGWMLWVLLRRLEIQCMAVSESKEAYRKLESRGLVFSPRFPGSLPIDY